MNQKTALKAISKSEIKPTTKKVLPIANINFQQKTYLKQNPKKCKIHPRKKSALFNTPSQISTQVQGYRLLSRNKNSSPPSAKITPHLRNAASAATDFPIGKPWILPFSQLANWTNQSLTSSSAISWAMVFFTRRLVKRECGLAYQHSFIIRHILLIG